ncbi:MAG: YfhO family protein, partial [Clostridia bacterium]|nr:YfhO family protein [Clostridia bacterium]
MMGYFWNNMWLDTVALYPLLCLATLKLFREGKSSLYIFVLALSLFSNYYIAYMSCIFTVLVFFILCVVDKVRFVDFLKKGLRFALASLWGAAISAVLLLPAFFGLLNTASTNGSPSLYVSFYESIRDLIAPLISFHDPAVMDGLPNLATAAILSLFAFAFLWAKRIGLREKLCAFFLLIFLLVSMNFSVLNYFWHGMHFTNMIPYRFAFLFAFAVVVMAYRYYKTGMEDFDYIDAIGMILFSGLTAFCAFGYYDTFSIIASVAVFVIGILLTALFAVKILPRRYLALAVSLVLVVETVASAWMGTKAVGFSSYSGYYDLETGEEVCEMVEIAKKSQEDSEEFYRLETTEWRSLNDSCFYNYNGISQFASSANRHVARFLQALGMPADPGSNRFVYVHGTPLANTALGIKYLVHKNGYLSDDGLTCISPADNDTTAALYENQGFSGLGFMIEEAAGDFSFDMSQAAYERQNALFRAMTGLEGDLLTVIPTAQEKHLNLTAEDRGNGYYEYEAKPLPAGEVSRVLNFSVKVPKTGMIYIYADVPKANYVQVNNNWHAIDEYPNFFSAGKFSANESFTLRAVVDEAGSSEFTDHALFYVCTFDEELWQEGLARLQDEKMEIAVFEDTYIKGIVKAEKDGYLYTSIPMEPEHSWEISVDGEPVEIVPFNGSFVGLYLPEGDHVVEFSYSPLGYAKGRWISLVAILLWAALILWERRGHKLVPEKPRPDPIVKEASDPETPECDEDREKQNESVEEPVPEEGGAMHDHPEADVSDPERD